MKLQINSILLVFLLAGSFICGTPENLRGEFVEPAPNILFITVDNLGYGELISFNNSSPILTPNLNKLANQVARLTSFYSASPPVLPHVQPCLQEEFHSATNRTNSW